METTLAGDKAKLGQAASPAFVGASASRSPRLQRPKSKSPGLAEFVAVRSDALLMLFKRLIIVFPFLTVLARCEWCYREPIRQLARAGVLFKLRSAHPLE